MTLCFSDDEDTERFARSLQTLRVDHLLNRPSSPSRLRENAAIWKSSPLVSREVCPSDEQAFVFDSPTKEKKDEDDAKDEIQDEGTNTENESPGRSNTPDIKDMDQKDDTPATTRSAYTRHRRQALRKIKEELASQRAGWSHVEDPDYIDLMDEDAGVPPTPFRLRSATRPSRIVYSDLDWTHKSGRRNRSGRLIFSDDEGDEGKNDQRGDNGADKENGREHEEGRRKERKRKKDSKNKKKRSGEEKNEAQSSLTAQFTASDDECLARFLPKPERKVLSVKRDPEGDSTFNVSGDYGNDDNAADMAEKRSQASNSRPIKTETEFDGNEARDDLFSVSDDDSLADIASRGESMMVRAESTKKNIEERRVCKTEIQSNNDRDDDLFNVSDEGSPVITAKKSASRIKPEPPVSENDDDDDGDGEEYRMRSKIERIARRVRTRRSARVEFDFSVSDDESLASMKRREEEGEETRASNVKEEPMSADDESTPVARRSAKRKIPTARAVFDGDRCMHDDASLANVAKRIKQEQPS